MTGDDAIAMFLNDLNQEIAAEANAHGAFTRHAMVANLAGRLVAAEELQDWTYAPFEGRGQRRRALQVDGFSVDEMELDGTLQLLIADLRSGSDVQTLSTADVNGAFARSLAFFEDAREGRLYAEMEPSREAADLAKLIHELRERIKTVRVLLLSNGSLGSRYKLSDQSIDGIKVELHIWDLVRFQRLADQGGREPIEIDVAAFAGSGIPALRAGIGDASYQAFLCVVPGKFLADVYDQHGSRILEGNVRAFLSARGKVNQGIRKTILAQPDRFFAFNNGITATATRVDFGADGSITKIVDLQVVNGGQTTVSLFNTRARDKADLDRVFVQMKLSVVQPEVAETMIPEISRYANTQNKVSEADLFANHPFNRKVEELSRRLWAPPKQNTTQMTRWFYERARAQYESAKLKLTGAQRTAFEKQHPKQQVITKTDLAKHENSFKMLPFVVSQGAQKNFVRYAESVCDDYSARPEEFNERWFQHMVAKAIVFADTDRLVRHAPWYTNAYKANIVTYAIAKLVHLIQASFPNACLDLDMIWKSQGVSINVGRQLQLTAKTAFDVILNPPQEGANITEWAKRKDCWDRLAAVHVPVFPELVRCLRTVGAERDDRRRARGDEREDATINAAMEVVRRREIGFWGRGLLWRTARQVLTPGEYGLLETAATSKAHWVPSDAQAKRLMDVAAKLEADGVV